MAYTKEDFLNTDVGKQFIDANSGVGQGGDKYGIKDRERAWEAYQKGGASWLPQQASAGAPNLSEAETIVPGTPKDESQINVATAAGEIAKDPGAIMNDDMKLSDNDLGISDQEEQAGMVDDSALDGFDKGGLNQTADQAQADTANQVDPREAESYEVEKTQDAVAEQDMEAAKGQVRDEAQIDADDIVIDTDAVARGETETGKALQDYASLDLDDIDPSATLKGQLEELQSDFTGPDGEPRIPPWAAGTARNVSKIAAFSGMSGTAATAAMAQALMEASISVAEQDAKFFQTVTLTNLNNKQAATINRANVLAQMDLANMDARMNAAVQNSKNFMEMDLANLSNEQQARAINTQNRVQSILEDAKAENTKRMFTAQSQNEMNMFYDNLNSQIEQFNTAQVNNMKQFNTSEANSMKKFNAELENQRDQFYRGMQYNIDVANAQWRQTVTLTENKNKFEAAALDVKNAVGISQEALNQLWDRADSLLDYAWKSAENQLDRDAAIALQTLQGKMANKAATTAGIGQVLGSVAGSLLSKIDIF